MTEQVERNRAAQEEVYGEPLGEVFRRLIQAFRITQAQLAGILGMSPPMLSQLITAQRVKIGNPAVLQRTSALEDLAEQVRSGSVPPAEVARRLEEIKGSTGHRTRTDSQAVGSTDEAVVSAVRGLLRAVASGQDLRGAVDLLQVGHPGLAEVLMVYGLGPEQPAREHFERHRDLF